MGKAALEGQPGVIAIIKALRRSPFREFNIVYYDPRATTVATLLQRLRADGCPNATHVEPQVATAGEHRVTLQSPVVVPGDWVWLTVKSPRAGARLRVVEPSAWPLPGGSKEWLLGEGERAVPVAIPKSHSQGKVSLELIAERTGHAGVRFSLEVDVVGAVR